MSNDTIPMYFRQFCIDIKGVYGPEFQNRRPTRAERSGIAAQYDAVGFSSCIGAVDGMKLHCNNCPSAKKVQYHNSKEGKLSTVSVEVWCDHSVYVWNCFAGRTGTNNNLRLLSVLPLFNDILTGKFNTHVLTPYKLLPNSRDRHLAYFLANVIYPR